MHHPDSQDEASRGVRRDLNRDGDKGKAAARGQPVWAITGGRIGGEVTVPSRAIHTDERAGKMIKSYPRLGGALGGSGPAPTFFTVTVNVTVPPGTKFPLWVTMAVISGGSG